MAKNFTFVVIYHLRCIQNANMQCMSGLPLDAAENTNELQLTSWVVEQGSYTDNCGDWDCVTYRIFTGWIEREKFVIKLSYDWVQWLECCWYMKVKDSVRISGFHIDPVIIFRVMFQNGSQLELKLVNCNEKEKKTPLIQQQIAVNNLWTENSHLSLGKVSGTWESVWVGAPHSMRWTCNAGPQSLVGCNRIRMRYKNRNWVLNLSDSAA
jgi:hypothetical protein